MRTFSNPRFLLKPSLFIPLILDHLIVVGTGPRARVYRCLSGFWTHSSELPAHLGK